MDAEQIVSDVAERVRDLLSQAEERAAAIIRDAEAEAARIRERAEADARGRVDELRSALDDLQGRLDAGGGRPGGEVTPGPVTVPEPAPPETPEPVPDPVPDPVPGPEPVPEPAPEPVPEPEPPLPDVPADVDDANGERSRDKSAARLVAMKMALDGASREEIGRALSSSYDLEHLDALLDDVLSRAKA